MANKINLILLFGGKSTEHEVSVKSARSIYQALDPDKYRVIPVGITKKGSWVKGKAVDLVLASGSQVDELPQKTSIMPDPNIRSLVSLNQTREITVNSADAAINVVFPVMHGIYGEDGTIQGLLEMANLAYVGCGVLGSALGMDKIKQKEILAFNKIPVVPYFWFKKTGWLANPKKVITDIETRFKSFYPLFTKPANTGSSVGITKVHNRDELIKGIEESAQYDTKILVEKGMENIREIETSILGNDEISVSVCGEIRPQAEFYDYDAKYVRDDTGLVIPAKLPKKVSDKVRDLAKKAFIAIDGSGMARADFFVTRKTHRIYLNELNTIPGFTDISMYPKLWEKSGITYNKLVDRLITLAIEKWNQKQQIRTSKT
jgi:D-alanine-D-alanine ligase